METVGLESDMHGLRVSASYDLAHARIDPVELKMRRASQKYTNVVACVSRDPRGDPGDTSPASNCLL